MYIQLKDVQALFKEKTGQRITRAGLYFIGNQEGFSVKRGSAVYFDKEKLLEYINTITMKIPEGFYSAEQIAEKTGIGVDWARVLLSEYKVDYIKSGRRRKSYFDMKQFVERRKQNGKG